MHNNPSGVFRMESIDLQVINPERNPTPKVIVESVTPRFRFSLAIYKAKLHNTLVPRPGIQPKPPTDVLMVWRAWNPAKTLQVASFDVADVQAEQSGDLLRRGRNIYFSQVRMERAQAFSKADARVVAMHRTRKTKRGNDLLGYSKAALEEAIMQVASLESQLVFLKKALKQRHVGKLRISKKKKDYAKVNLPKVRKALPKWKAKVRRLERVLEKFQPSAE